MPFARCLLTVRQATALTAQPPGQGEMGTMLLGLRYHRSEGVVQVDADRGPAFRVSVAAIDLEVAVTDEAAFYRKRRERWWQVDTPWEG